MSGIRGYPNIRSSVKATDDKTLTVQLSRPDCQFPARAANPVFSPLPEEDAETAKPIGNGPFMVESATLGQNVVLARWDDYAIGDKAYLDKVELLVADTPEVALEGANSGEFDWVRISGPQLREARDEHAPKGNWISREMFGYTGMVPMVKNKPFTSAAARKAISYAIDREKLAEVLYEGSLPPATGLISPTFTDTYRPGGCEPCEYDPAGPSSSPGRPN